MSIYDPKPIGLDKVKTYPLASRPSKVSLDDFAKPVGEASSLQSFLASLPNILAVQSLRDLAAQMRRARDHRPYAPRFRQCDCHERLSPCSRRRNRDGGLDL